MNKKEFKEHWKILTDSFKLKADFLYIFFYDLLLYGIMIPLFSLFIFILNKKAEAVDPNILSNLNSVMNITAAQAQQIQQASQAVQSYLYTFLGAGLLFIIIALLAFTLTRALIWNHLLKKKFELKKYLKFNLLILLLAFLAVILYIILRIIAPLIINIFLKISINFALILSSILYLLVFMAIIYFASLIYINHTKTGKIFNSFSKTFRLIKTKFQKISISYLFIFLVSIIVVLIAMLRWLLPYYLQMYFNYAVVLSFLAWMRIYITSVK